MRDAHNDPDPIPMPQTPAVHNRADVLALLDAHKAVLREQFGVVEINLVGSFARDQARPDSDIDVIVEFAGKPSLLTYAGASNYIREASGRKVDLFQLEDIRAELLPSIVRDMTDPENPMPERAWKFRITDMISFGELVLLSAGGLTIEEIVDNREKYDSIILNIQRIGEAATSAPPDVRARHPQIPWQRIVAMRNQLVHNYPHIQQRNVDHTIRVSIPELLTQLRALLELESVDAE